MPTVLAAAIFSAQAPGAGWVMKPAPDGEVQQLYWAEFKQTEVWIHLEPHRRTGEIAPFYLIFSVIFDGKTQQHPADSVMVQAIAAPNMLVDRLSLELILDGEKHLALDAPPYFPHQIYSQSAEFPGGPAGLQVMVPIAIVKELADAEKIEGDVLGIKIVLHAPQIAALGRFLARVGAQ